MLRSVTLPAFAVLAVLLTGCGGDGDDSPEGTSTSSSAPAPGPYGLPDAVGTAKPGEESAPASDGASDSDDSGTSAAEGGGGGAGADSDDGSGNGDGTGGGSGNGGSGAGSDDDGSSNGGGGSTTNPVASDATVKRQPFCGKIDPTQVAGLLDVTGMKRLAQAEPGKEYEPVPGAEPIESDDWLCTIGKGGGPDIGVTWTIVGSPQSAGTLKDRQRNTAALLGGDSCTKVSGGELGTGTLGVDCQQSGGSGGAYAAVSRFNEIDGTVLECFANSTGSPRLADLRSAIGKLCGMFLDAVVE